MAFPLGWPPRVSSGQRTFRFYTSGTSTANFSDNAFLFHSTNAASAVIGGVDVNGFVIVYTTATGPAANEYTIEVKVAAAPSTALSAAFEPSTSKNIVVTLATDASGAPDDTANTATLVAAAVTALTGIDTIANGTGATPLRKPEPKKSFFGGGPIIVPTPIVPPGGASTIARVGTVAAPGSPMGTGTQVDSSNDVYAPPGPYVFAQYILVANDDGTATNTLEISFDGVNVHGLVRGGQTLEFRHRSEAGIAVRRGANTPAFRIHAW